MQLHELGQAEPSPASCGSVSTRRVCACMRSLQISRLHCTPITWKCIVCQQALYRTSRSSTVSMPHSVVTQEKTYQFMGYNYNYNLLSCKNSFLISCRGDQPPVSQSPLQGRQCRVCNFFLTAPGSILKLMSSLDWHIG